MRTLMAWEYGPNAATALSVAMTCFPEAAVTATKRRSDGARQRIARGMRVESVTEERARDDMF